MRYIREEYHKPGGYGILSHGRGRAGFVRSLRGVGSHSGQVTQFEPITFGGHGIGYGMTQEGAKCRFAIWMTRGFPMFTALYESRKDSVYLHHRKGVTGPWAS